MDMDGNVDAIKSKPKPHDNGEKKALEFGNPKSSLRNSPSNASGRVALSL